MSGGHRGPVNAIVRNGNTIISAGQDGFLELWDASSGNALQRFQISPYNIIAMAHKPGTNEVCVVENDGLGLFQISAWNYRNRQNIFTLRFRDPIGFITYSAEGNFIIAARTGRTGLVFIDSVTGDVLQSPQSLTGIAGFAVTGRSERNMMVYFNSGAISYWNLDTGRETNRFSAPSNLSSPILFGNNRYFAGVSSRGLAVVNALTGEVLAWDNSVPAGSLLSAEGNEFICLVQENETIQLFRYSFDRESNLFSTAISLSITDAETGGRFTSIAVNGTTILGTAAGSLMITDRTGQLQTLNAREQLQIIDTVVTGQSIVFLAENGKMGFIPLDFNRLTAVNTVSIEQVDEVWNRITAFNTEDNNAGQIILWQDQNNRTLPAIRSIRRDSQTTELNINLRSPIRTTASFGGRILFLDTIGNLSVISPELNIEAETENFTSQPFTFFSMGLMCAAFINNQQIILGRSAVAGNTPFLVLNTTTGETVPLPYDVQAGVTMYRGESGSIYAVTVSPQHEGSLTSIVQLDTANSVNSTRLVDFHGEDIYFSFTETPGGSAGRIAATIGGDGAAIYSAAGIQKLDRTAGLPLRLINGGARLIKLDRDGNIAWYDSNNGRLLAIFRLHPDSWTLQTERGLLTGGFFR
jgi:WD40 repeat protein